MSRTTQLAAIARVMNLTPQQATYLPACVSVIAKKMNMQEQAVINKLEDSKELRDYVRAAIEQSEHH
ncbi:hypothetical protein [Delftia phage PhiW-14]|uniref:Uncharacterized protein n=1 Tax=Delftia phage PhiW-14 TaxID=665032 RepID=C9DGB4_BPW14|nr:hypothetical protein DP-phiW-14_gp144 [Delftia phage PhiW-14]ACV50165.1 hypothetical protein [Delftia phage PhiW-14]